MQTTTLEYQGIENRVYCLYRVSTLGQIDKMRDDIPMQRQACHEYIAEQGWNFVDELSEKGISGFKVSAKDRDAIQILQQKALIFCLYLCLTGWDALKAKRRLL